MLDTIIHRWFRLPYSLYVRHNHRPKNPRATILFIHGIGNSGAAWDKVIARLPSDVGVVSVDLLGFGKSPRPKWAVYNARSQARAVLATYLKLGITSRVIIVGHSLGSLVAVEITRRYPLLVNSLILCSPPLYDMSDRNNTLLPKTDWILRRLYRSAKRRPGEFVRLSTYATKYKLINNSFNVTSENIDSYMATLESTIINQTSYKDAYKLSKPTEILQGSLDPFVVTRNLKQLSKVNQSIILTNVLAGHEIKGRFVSAIVEAINRRLKEL